MQKIRLAIRGWSRRREEREKEFLAKNTWSPSECGGSTLPSRALSSQHTPKALQVDLEGLTVAYLDDSGQILHYLDIESGEVIDTREVMTGDRYRRVPSRSGQSEFDERRAFIDALDPSEGRDRLASCVGVAEAFRRTLATDRKLERAWYNFKNDRAIAVVRQWLAEIGLQ